MTPDSSRRVHTSVVEGVATVTLDYPTKRNVLDRVGWQDLGQAVAELSAALDVRCVVLRGAGTAAFSAGSDISAFPEQRWQPEDVEGYGAAIHGTLREIRSCRHPTLAAVQGVCVGGGLEIAVSCDLRVCGASSRFGAPIGRLGVTMAYEELGPIVQVVGPAAALDLLLTGESIDAGRALEIGLVSRVFPDDALDAEVAELLRRIAAGAPLVHRWHKRFVRRLGEGGPLTDAERAEAYDAFATRDYREGVQAFQEKRDPRFEGR